MQNGQQEFHILFIRLNHRPHIMVPTFSFLQDLMFYLNVKGFCVVSLIFYVFSVHNSHNLHYTPCLHLQYLTDNKQGNGLLQQVNSLFLLSHFPINTFG